MFAFLLLPVSLGCNGLNLGSAGTPGQTGPQTYMAPIMAGTANSGATGGATSQLATYIVDDSASTFSQTTTSFSGAQQGTQDNNAGTFTVLARGLRRLATTYSFPYANNGAVTGTTYSSANQPISYAVELAGQAGGLVQLQGQAATPLAATAVCPAISTAQTYQFITLPAAVTSSASVNNLAWNPSSQTAFGSVSISASGTAYSLGNIQQFTLPASGGQPAAPTAAYAATASGHCSQTPYGYTLSVPDTVTVSGSNTATPSAAIGIGPTGLLVENNGGSADNLLGAGTGAIGVPQPASALTTSSVVGAQYLGFVYGSGVSSNSASGWSSTLASFGFAAQPSTCTSVAPGTATLIYGGDFPSNDPASSAVQANGGYGNCNLAIDLGTQSSTSNGLYPHATVTIGSGFSAGTSIALDTFPVSFPAVAVVGQLAGKYVILLVGKDKVQAWSIYLMQSN
jgi:hypothetical protein